MLDPHFNLEDPLFFFPFGTLIPLLRRGNGKNKKSNYPERKKDVPLFGAEEMHAETRTGLFLMVCNM